MTPIYHPRAKIWQNIDIWRPYWIYANEILFQECLKVF